MIKDIYIYERSKHINIIYHIRDFYTQNLIKLNYVSRANMIVNNLTKSLLKNKFKIFVKQLRFQGLKVSKNQSHRLIN